MSSLMMEELNVSRFTHGTTFCALLVRCALMVGGNFSDLTPTGRLRLCGGGAGQADWTRWKWVNICGNKEIATDLQPPPSHEKCTAGNLRPSTVCTSEYPRCEGHYCTTYGERQQGSPPSPSVALSTGILNICNFIDYCFFFFQVVIDLDLADVYVVLDKMDYDLSQVLQMSSRGELEMDLQQRRFVDIPWKIKLKWLAITGLTGFPFANKCFGEKDKSNLQNNWMALKKINNYKT